MTAPLPTLLPPPAPLAPADRRREGALQGLLALLDMYVCMYVCMCVCVCVCVCVYTHTHIHTLTLTLTLTPTPTTIQIIIARLRQKPKINKQ